MKKSIIFILLCILTLPGLTKANGVTTGSEKIKIFTSIPPMAYLIEQIGKDRVHAQVLVPPEQSLHTYQPSPRQMTRLGEAKIYFKINLPFEERALAKIMDNHNTLSVSNCARGVKFRSFGGHHHGDHKEKDSHDSHGNEDDPHIWLGIPQIKTMTKNITEKLSSFDPDNKDFYTKNFAEFTQKIDLIDRDISKRLAPYRGHKIFVFHPSFGYFTDNYHLIQEAVEVEGKTPSPRQLAQLINEAVNDGVKIIFVQPQFDSKSAKTIANAIKGDVVPMDPLKRDLLKNLEEMAGKIENAFQ